jgi:hypothetical protein
VRRALLPLSISLAFSTGSAALADQAPPLTLRWSVPEGDDCPDRAAVEREIGRMLGPDDGLRKAVTAEANVVRRSSGDFRVSLIVATDETRSTRSFKATSCREASEASALIVALAIDSRARAPESPASKPSPSPSPSPPSVPAPALPPARVKPRPPATEAREATPAEPTRGHGRGSLGFAVSGRLVSGMQPGVAFGVEAGLVGTWGAWRLEAVFAFSPSTRAELSESPNKGGDVSSFGLAGRGCHIFSLGTRVGLGPCVSAGLLRVTGTAFGTERVTSGSATWGAFAGEAMARVALSSRFALRGTVGPTVALDRPTFVIETGSEKIPVFRPDTVGLSAHIGVEARFF